MWTVPTCGGRRRWFECPRTRACRAAGNKRSALPPYGPLQSASRLKRVCGSRVQDRFSAPSNGGEGLTFVLPF
jgi:hypothetical protein